MFAVETTEKADHCGIQARNIKLFRTWRSAKRQAVLFALSHRDGRVRESTNICWDGFLDGTQKIFDSTDGTEETAPALAFITKIVSSA
ncbi:MAG: hypothetical protein E4H40_08705 [Candidatus Brocadiia bacterium]|nr:MAG: hypothetical protein E4H40_08705 [Candidatus Brocadiia bacterium]